MSSTDRIAVAAEQLRRARYPEAVVDAASRYLAGQGALSTAYQEWRAAVQARHNLAPGTAQHFIHALDPAAAPLDALDRRLLDLALTLGNEYQVIESVVPRGRVAEVCDHLLRQGMTESRLLSLLLRYHYRFVDSAGRPTPGGHYLLGYLPERLDDLLQLLRQDPSGTHDVVHLLLAAAPPAIELAWQLTQAMETEPHVQRARIAALLLAADPERFTDWCRQFAGPGSPVDEQQRLVALEALLAHDRARHLDLAIEAARMPIAAASPWHVADLKNAGMKAVYEFDPSAAWPLIEEAALSPHVVVRDFAVTLLAGANFAQARPVLQRCVHEGDVRTALKALAVLLKRDWAGRDEWALGLLAHRSRQVREVIAERLAGRGEAAIDTVAPYLSHRSADARLAAVETLQRIGGERARGLLAARLDAEKGQQVRRAILDVVGVPEAAAAPPAELPAAAPAGAAIVAEAEATLRRVAGPVPAWFDLDRAPAPRWTTGEPVPTAVLRYLLYLQSRHKEPSVAERARPALALLDRGTTGDLALALWQAWLAHGADSKTAWCLPLVGALGDDRLVQPLREQIEAWGKGTRGALAARAVAALGLLGGDLALAELDDIAQRVKHQQVVAAARQAMRDMAERQGVTLDELVDRLVPRLGLDERGERAFDYGPRRFVARLGPDLALRLRDGAGKERKALPKPKADDDVARAAAAQAEWQEFKARVTEVAKEQTARLEQALVTQRAWSVDRWRELFLHHPLLRPLAPNLVWGVVDPAGDGYTVLFRPLEDGTLTDAEDEPVELPAEGRIRLAHPLELDEATRETWLAHLADYEVTPPFPQLTRPTLRVEPAERDARWWDRYRGYVMNGGALKRRYQQAGWQHITGRHYTIWKAFPAAGVEAVLETPGLALGYEHYCKAALKQLGFVPAGTLQRGGYIHESFGDDDPQLLPLGEVPPVAFSEAAADVQTFAAVGAYDADWERKV